jgi:hypothetical protein
VVYIKWTQTSRDKTNLEQIMKIYVPWNDNKLVENVPGTTKMYTIQTIQMEVHILDTCAGEILPHVVCALAKLFETPIIIRQLEVIEFMAIVVLLTLAPLGDMAQIGSTVYLCFVVQGKQGKCSTVHLFVFVSGSFT